MTLDEFFSLSQLATAEHSDRIVALGWWLHEHKSRDSFSGADIGKLYDELHISRPSNFSPYLQRLCEGAKPRLLKNRRGYRLSQPSRAICSSKWSVRASTTAVHAALESLVSQVTSDTQRAFLGETMVCLKATAYRASIVMAWNLAYDHLCAIVINDRLSAFNSQLPKSFPNARIRQIVARVDLESLKESEVIQVCRSANIITGNMAKLMQAKLDRRNAAAHPSSMMFTQLQAEEFVHDLVQNIILSL